MRLASSSISATEPTSPTPVRIEDQSRALSDPGLRHARIRRVAARDQCPGPQSRHQPWWSRSTARLGLEIVFLGTRRIDDEARHRDLAGDLLGDRAREIIALQMRRARHAQRLNLRLGLDAFSDDAQAKRTREVDDRVDDRGAFALAAHAVDEAAIDLQRIEREFADIVEARIAGAEIVERDAEAHLPQFVECIGGTVRIVEDRRLGYLDLDAVGLDARTLDTFEHMANKVGAPELARREVDRDILAGPGPSGPSAIQRAPNRPVRESGSIPRRSG